MIPFGWFLFGKGGLVCRVRVLDGGLMVSLVLNVGY